jgi:hypoxanthine phosphoribosyltransferase
MQSYDYSHRTGIEEMSWERFAQLSHILTEKLAATGVEVVVGIARAGLFPATAVVCALRCEFFPVRVSRRVNDQVTFKQPVWRVDVSPAVAGKIVAVVDEIADTGETIALVAERVKELGVAKVVTATLISHSWANPPIEVTGLVTDALVIFPWDKQVYLDGRWQLHPELQEALNLQEQSERLDKGE